jgi:hypothetical protein
MQWKAIGKLTIALALGISPLASAGGAKPADGYALDANSKTALVVVKTDWWQPAPSMQSAFKLTLSVYDPVEEKPSTWPRDRASVRSTRVSWPPFAECWAAPRPG